MNIILSGGWGYGNLGDDAILVSTIKLLRKVYTNCHITVLTYEPSVAVFNDMDYIKYSASVHNIIDFDAADAYFAKILMYPNIVSKIGTKVKALIFDNFFTASLLCTYCDFEMLKSHISQADLFIFGGGGYLNEDWINNIVAHCHEANLCKDAGVPYIIAGSGFGKLKKSKVKSVFNRFLTNAQAIWVRDEFSLQDLSNCGIKAAMIPDVALTEFAGKKDPENIIGIIVNKDNARFLNKLASALAKICQTKFIVIKLIITRVWQNDLRALFAIQTELSRHGLMCELIIPNSVFVLNRSLETCRLVISENLHGLIMAYRVGVPIIAINNYRNGSPNWRKFSAFMNQIDSIDQTLDDHCSVESMSFIIGSTLDKNSFKDQHLEFCNYTFEQASNFLNNVLRGN